MAYQLHSYAVLCGTTQNNRAQMTTNLSQASSSAQFNVSFRSKRGLVLVIHFVVIISLFILLLQDPSVGKALISATIIAFFGWVWFGTDYTITKEDLKIRAGPFRWRISLKDIKRIQQPSTPFEFSAILSFDRVVIRYGRFGDRIQVSPVDKVGFLRLMQQRTPQAEVDDTLKRLL